MTRHYHFELIAILFSALIHAAIAIPYLSGKLSAPATRPTTTPLKLAMFKAAPEVVQAEIPPPVKPPTPAPKPVVTKPVLKKKPKPALKKKPVIKPVVEKKVEPPEPEVEQPETVAQSTPPPQPPAPIRQQEPEQMLHDPGLIARLEDQYKLTLSKLIDASKQYPRRAQRRNMEGKATVSFIIMRDGSVKEIRLVQSTGYKVLDNAVLEAIQSVSGKLPLPAEINRQQWKFKIPLSFSLS